MYSILRQIYRDHARIIRLMDLLDAQLVLFNRGEEPDYGLMTDIMHYMLNYPDIAHHPAEERIFNLLKKPRHRCSACLRRELEQLAAEHQELHESGLAFVDILQSVAEGCGIVARGNVRKRAADYVALLRGHIRREEADILPFAEQELTAGEWRDIEQNLPAVADPMGSEYLLSDYSALYAYLNRE